MPAAPRLAFTRRYASITTCFEISNDFVDFTRSSPLLGWLMPRPDNAVPSLHAHYRRFNTTADSSAPGFRFGILSHGVSHLSFPLASKVRFSRSVPEPASRRCHLYTGCRLSNTQVVLKLIPEVVFVPRFRQHLRLFDESSAVRFRSSPRHSPDVLKGRLFQCRSPPRLLNAAAHGGLASAPASRRREAHSHLLHSFADSSPRS